MNKETTDRLAARFVEELDEIAASAQRFAAEVAATEEAATCAEDITQRCHHLRHEIWTEGVTDWQPLIPIHALSHELCDLRAENYPAYIQMIRARNRERFPAE